MEHTRNLHRFVDEPLLIGPDEIPKLVRLVP
jgi:hypothetical protein